MADALRFLPSVQVVAPTPRSGFAILPEKFLQFLQHVCLRAKVAQGPPLNVGRCNSFPHLGPAVPVEAVPLDKYRLDLESVKNVFKRELDSCGAGTG